MGGHRPSWLRHTAAARAATAPCTLFGGDGHTRAQQGPRRAGCRLPTRAWRPHHGWLGGTDLVNPVGARVEVQEQWLLVSHEAVSATQIRHKCMHYHP